MSNLVALSPDAGLRYPVTDFLYAPDRMHYMQ